MAGEMLEGAGNARIGKPGARPAHKFGGGLRFTAERAGTDDRVIGVGVHIGHRGKIDLYSNQSALAGHFFSISIK